MADQLSHSGVNVIFFSFEQSTFEIISKGISRETSYAMNTTVNIPSATQIRGGASGQDIERAKDVYATKTANQYIVQCDFQTTINDIEYTINKFIQEHSLEKPPVIFIDYLQVISGDTSGNTKQHMDMIVRRLKQLTKDPAKALTIILISSFNRSNYLTPVSFESFKESGGIEYTADVIWGLQLAVMNNEIFNSKEKIAEKRRAVNEAKAANPRIIELVVLKNRYGQVGESFQFRYYPHCDLYEVNIPTIRRILHENEE